MTAPGTVVRTSLLIFCSCLLALTSLAGGVWFINSQVLHRAYPYDTLFAPRPFSDLTDMYERIRNLGAGASVLLDQSKSLFVPFNYPPPALYVQSFFIKLFPHPV